ncbi:MAG: hypothetical protein HYU97_09285 [Deltaproteobacteria bacterium]|nr:hypothetical protein [Deltaproteobacteria bacterium]
MNTVTLKDLKEDLSSWAEKAAKGEIIHVTKYNRPYIVLAPSNPKGLHVGSRVGKGRFVTVVKRRGVGKLALKALQEDREEN